MQAKTRSPASSTPPQADYAYDRIVPAVPIPQRRTSTSWDTFVDALLRTQSRAGQSRQIPASSSSPSRAATSYSRHCDSLVTPSGQSSESLGSMSKPATSHRRIRPPPSPINDKVQREMISLAKKKQISLPPISTGKSLQFQSTPTTLPAQQLTASSSTAAFVPNTTEEDDETPAITPPARRTSNVFEMLSDAARRYEYQQHQEELRRMSRGEGGAGEGEASNSGAERIAEMTEFTETPQLQTNRSKVLAPSSSTPSTMIDKKAVSASPSSTLRTMIDKRDLPASTQSIGSAIVKGGTGLPRSPQGGSSSGGSVVTFADARILEAESKHGLNQQSSITSDLKKRTTRIRMSSKPTTKTNTIHSTETGRGSGRLGGVTSASDEPLRDGAASNNDPDGTPSVSQPDIELASEKKILEFPLDETAPDRNTDDANRVAGHDEGHSLSSSQEPISASTSIAVDGLTVGDQNARSQGLLLAKPTPVKMTIFEEDNIIEEAPQQLLNGPAAIEPQHVTVPSAAASRPHLPKVPQAIKANAKKKVTGVKHIPPIPTALPAYDWQARTHALMTAPSDQHSVGQGKHITSHSQTKAGSQLLVSQAHCRFFSNAIQSSIFDTRSASQRRCIRRRESTPSLASDAV